MPPGCSPEPGQMVSATPELVCQPRHPNDEFATCPNRKDRTDDFALMHLSLSPGGYCM